jgi:hypothetical protein
MWEDFIHHIYDIFYIAQWLLDSLKDIFLIVLAPLSWIFNFGKGFLVGIGTIPEEISFALPDTAKTLLQSFPHLDLLFTAIGGGLGILFLAFIFKKINQI